MLTSEAKFPLRTVSLQPQTLSACHSIQQKHSWKLDRVSLLLGVAIVAVGFLIAIANPYMVQKTIAQVCTRCWQVSLIFGLIALMVSLLLAQVYLTYHRDRTQSTLNRWNVLSSITVVVFTTSLIACILVLPPIG
jgi:vacuolar-type H+-ATPase subunit I/STV1